MHRRLVNLVPHQPIAERQWRPNFVPCLPVECVWSPPPTNRRKAMETGRSRIRLAEGYRMSPTNQSPKGNGDLYSLFLLSTGIQSPTNQSPKGNGDPIAWRKTIGVVKGGPPPTNRRKAMETIHLAVAIIFEQPNQSPTDQSPKGNGDDLTR